MAAHHVLAVKDVVPLVADDAAGKEARREACRGEGAGEPVVALLEQWSSS